VVDAATGALRYSVPNVSGPTGQGQAPLLVRDGAGDLIAYTAFASSASAVRLGATSGEKIWTRIGDFGGMSAPTLAGDRLILAGPGSGVAYALKDGEEDRRFSLSPYSGGGGNTAAYDAARRQFYVPNNSDLTAWSLDGTGPLERKWRIDNFGSNLGRSVAIGPDGKVYTTVQAGLQEIDPDTGAVLRLVPGRFDVGAAPLVQGGYVWVGGLQAQAFDLDTLRPVASLPASPLEYYTYTPVAADDSHLVVQYVGLGTVRGFTVYAVPEPAVATLLAPAACLLLRRRRGESSRRVR
jgi:hypothetical protein